MSRLLRIEIHKLRSYRAFWILLGLYLLSLALTLLAIQGIVNTFFIESGPTIGGFQPQMDFNSFPDVWHYMTYIGGFFHVILGVIVIILTCNEYNYKTIRQNIINGLSRWEVLFSKLVLIFFFAAASTLVVLLITLLLGFTHSAAHEIGRMLTKAPYILAYFLQLSGYLMIAFLIGTLVRRSGIAIGIMLMYIWVVEKVLAYYTPDSIDQFFPLVAMNNLIPVPFTDFINIIDAPSVWQSTTVTIAYLGIFAGLVYMVLKRKDL